MISKCLAVVGATLWHSRKCPHDSQTPTASTKCGGRRRWRLQSLRIDRRLAAAQAVLESAP